MKETKPLVNYEESIRIKKLTRKFFQKPVLDKLRARKEITKLRARKSIKTPLSSIPMLFKVVSYFYI